MLALTLALASAPAFADSSVPWNPGPPIVRLRVARARGIAAARRAAFVYGEADIPVEEWPATAPAVDPQPYDAESVEWGVWLRARDAEWCRILAARHRTDTGEACQVQAAKP